MEGLKWRSAVAIGGLLLLFAWVAPNFINTEKIWWPAKKKLNYGLDIQGGIHLVMGVDVEGVVSESTTRLVTVLDGEFKKENIAVTGVKSAKPTQGEIEITFAGSEAKDKITKWIDDRYPATLQVISSTDSSLQLRYFDSYLTDYKNKVIHQSIETIRNRIDEFGVAEPSISQQGSDRILVQLPGMSDAERAKSLINTTAKLDFMPVSQEKSPQELAAMIADAEKAGNYSLGTLKYTEYVTRLNNDLKTKLPENTVIYFEKTETAQNMEQGKFPVLLKTNSGLGGGDLDDAHVSFDEYGTPIVAIRFNPVGATKFKALTTEYVGRQVAIVLDRIVKSAPSIREPIGGGAATITLGGGRGRDKTLEEAKMISTALRAGALPASLEQLEERRVGPSLGADSIRKATLASLIGAIAILIFMTLRYRAMGVISNLSLVVNILGVFALLTSLGATLTLPGIAGIALTVGFAVDANVLINERMREELLKGNSFLAAVREGYSRAMSAILDANATVAATAVVLLYFGTGPVRGFAVTLLIGIATTLFANVFFSKFVVDTLTSKFGIKKLSV